MFWSLPRKESLWWGALQGPGWNIVDIEGRVETAVSVLEPEPPLYSLRAKMLVSSSVRKLVTL